MAKREGFSGELLSSLCYHRLNVEDPISMPIEPVQSKDQQSQPHHTYHLGSSFVKFQHALADPRLVPFRAASNLSDILSSFASSVEKKVRAPQATHGCGTHGECSRELGTVLENEDAGSV